MGTLILIGVAFLAVIITIAVMVENAKTKATNRQRGRLSQSDFAAEVIHGSAFGKLGIAIDGTRRKFAILQGDNAPKIFDFSQLTAVEVYRDGNSLTKTNRGGQVAGAAVGAVLLGPAGLLLGGLTGSKRSIEMISKLSLMIYVNDFIQPTYEVVFHQHLGSGGTKVSDLTLTMKELNAWHGRMQAILATTAAGQPSPVTA
ncbi:hypothetical protein HJC05_20030 [Rhizobium sp. NLR9a]|uniref:hypothetical protein n=1 Tax=unclassified Rhizobium TaxID=2613769 RepID=UPI001C8317E0|nr:MULTISPECIES: hypothetical protein [unclassified Rhizobium]MBX5216479.1 hypothetical protein [Rhizobium sp. NLR9a]MBX5277839.1 hypothetical protein [Rhizobium sp. NLR13a]